MEKRQPDAALKALDAALARGLADAEAGRVMSLDEAFKRLRAELDGDSAPSTDEQSRP